MRRKPRLQGKYIALRDVEAEYGLNYHLVYRLITSGKLPRLSTEVTGRSISIPRAALDKFLEENTVAETR